MKKVGILLGLSSLLMITACSHGTANQYFNPKIRNEKIKQQRFQEDSLRCEVFADRLVGNPQTPVVLPPGSGTFTATDSRGEIYHGTYQSMGSFSSGLLAGSAFADGIATGVRRNRAWEYCMLTLGWHKLEQN